MKQEIWYSVENCGDGSAYPTFVESEALAELDQRYMMEGWGEPCVGSLVVTSDSPIIVEGLVTLDDMLKEAKIDLKSYCDEDKVGLREKIAALKLLKAGGEIPTPV